MYNTNAPDENRGRFCWGDSKNLFYIPSLRGTKQSRTIQYGSVDRGLLRASQ
jgi:hypothetical protein